MAEQTHYGTGHNITADNVYLNDFARVSSDLAAVVNVLAKRLIFSDVENHAPSSPHDPEEKIRYNNVVKFKSIIDEYKSYVGILSSIYQEFDNQGTNRTHTVLENIRLAYIKERGELISANPGTKLMDVIRQSADNIIHKVEAIMLNEIRSSSNIEVSSESINLSLQIVLIDAFIRCKILEKPL